MFTEFPELLASIYVTESLGNELLYAEGMREGAVCVVPVPCGSGSMWFPYSYDFLTIKSARIVGFGQDVLYFLRHF